MGNDKKSYFIIDLGHLKGGLIFPFHVYLFNPTSKRYTPLLYANSPLEGDAKKLMDKSLGQGAKLAIDSFQKFTFLKAQNLKESDVPSLAQVSQQEKVKQDPLYKAQQKRSENLAKKQAAGAFILRDELNQAIEGDNFYPLIKQARLELICLPPTISPTVSLAAYLANLFLRKDNMQNRIVTLSYMFAKNLDIKDKEALADLICAAFFCHLGHTQLDNSFSHKPQLEFYEGDKKSYRKHPGLAQHLLRKSGIKLSDRCLTIINQHHERFDGSGYPDRKQAEHIEQLSLVLGLCAHMVEYSSGKISGTKTSLKSVINQIQAKRASPGLEVQFGETLRNFLGTLLSSGQPRSKKMSEKEKADNAANSDAQEPEIDPEIMAEYAEYMEGTDIDYSKAS